MTVELPDKHLQGLRVTPDRLKLEAGIGLYPSGEVTLGQAALVAGISQTQFLHELGKRRISINYTLEDLEHDLETIRAVYAGTCPSPHPMGRGLGRGATATAYFYGYWL
ncbi:MAG: UPF0175 family protein [Verrucomicrobia bacterium]|nr:UPF0175 family protein [Verrucomicrobiota bacterium]